MKHDDLEALAADLTEANEGRPIASVKQAAALTGKSVSSIRSAIYRGALIGSRDAKNGPIRLRLRELARWLIDGERNSLPEPKDSPGDPR